MWGSYQIWYTIWKYFLPFFEFSSVCSGVPGGTKVFHLDQVRFICFLSAFAVAPKKALPRPSSWRFTTCFFLRAWWFGHVHLGLRSILSWPGVHCEGGIRPRSWTHTPGWSAVLRSGGEPVTFQKRSGKRMWIRSRTHATALIHSLYPCNKSRVSKKEVNNLTLINWCLTWNPSFSRTQECAIHDLPRTDPRHPCSWNGWSWVRSNLMFSVSFSSTAHPSRKTSRSFPVFAHSLIKW